MASSLVLHSFVQKLAEEDTHSDIGKALMGVGGAGLVGAGLMAGHNHMESSIQKQVEQLAKQRGGGMSNVDRALVAAPLLFGGVSWAANKVTARNQEKAKKIMDEAAAIRSMIKKMDGPVSSGSAVTARPYTMRSAIDEVRQSAQRKPLITPTTDPNAYNVQAVKSAEDDNRAMIGGAGLLAAGGAGAYMHSQHQAAQAAQRAAQEAAAAQRSANIARMKGIGKGVAGGLGIAGLLAGLGVAGNFAKKKVVQGIQNRAHGLGNVMNEAITKGITPHHPEWGAIQQKIKQETPFIHNVRGTGAQFEEQVVKDINEAIPNSQKPSVRYEMGGINAPKQKELQIQEVPDSRRLSVRYSERFGKLDNRQIEQEALNDAQLKINKEEEINNRVNKVMNGQEAAQATSPALEKAEKELMALKLKNKLKGEQALIENQYGLKFDEHGEPKFAASAGAAMFPKAEGGASQLSQRR